MEKLWSAYVWALTRGPLNRLWDRLAARLVPDTTDVSIHEPFMEGDDALLAVKVWRGDSKQALIEFCSMEGPYSIRVPQTALRRRES